MGSPGEAKVSSPIDKTGAPQLPREVPSSILDMFGRVGSGNDNNSPTVPTGTPSNAQGGIPFNYNTRGMNFNQMRVQQEIANAAKPATPAPQAVPSPKPPYSHDPGVRSMNPRPFDFSGVSGGGANFAPNTGLSSQTQFGANPGK